MSWVVGFCFGHLIHSILILTYRGIILRSEDQAASECMSVITFAIEILYPIYSITLLFFIFKYSNVSGFALEIATLNWKLCLSAGHHQQEAGLSSFWVHALFGFQPMLLAMDDLSGDCRIYPELKL